MKFFNKWNNFKSMSNELNKNVMEKTLESMNLKWRPNYLKPREQLFNKKLKISKKIYT